MKETINFAIAPVQVSGSKSPTETELRLISNQHHPAVNGADHPSLSATNRTADHRPDKSSPKDWAIIHTNG
ncbi:hypothetical protein DSO57_1028457 [Entomophthora muscae]|uniref:Uncharacterized protein n=1 Tax=Entomophthora muscae TaxID=34485 RepID=A0ACC2TZB7_9FUNG|nr:hypothetical protein DSO57_1028457 [Entomophthora muscae]